jgi:hypothetical protein
MIDNKKFYELHPSPEFGNFTFKEETFGYLSLSLSL